MGGSESFYIGVDVDKCTRCGACVETCPAHIFYMESEEILTRYRDHCILCGHCICVCPVDAVIHSGLETSEFVEIKKGMEIDRDTLYQFLRSRRSCRSFRDKAVPKEELETLIDTARFAPTAHNWQNFEFIVVSDKERVMRLSKITSEFYGKMADALEGNRESLPEYLKGLLHGARLNYEFSRAGKDRIFRGAPAVIVVHADPTNPSAAENCHYAVSYIVMMAKGMGLGATIIGYFVGAAPHSPEIVKEIGVPEGNQVFGCVAVGYQKSKYLKMPARNRAKVEWL
ncbi:MAG: nitroreductase family protein [Deltaproteobacteria bacterium]|uniref:Nitroreductase family protein n=1 Tax=Candidatus Zymogenus saltonus TaxID=2844893 RepID=A0A9D8KDH6_9DELT|nr:nitroreductase family protein [Candidatus Zymogenus saltonus]